MKPLSHKDFAQELGISERTLSRQRNRIEADHDTSYLSGKTRYYRPETMHLYRPNTASNPSGALAVLEGELIEHQSGLAASLSETIQSIHIGGQETTSLFDQFDKVLREQARIKGEQSAIQSVAAYFEAHQSATNRLMDAMIESRTKK